VLAESRLLQPRDAGCFDDADLRVASYGHGLRVGLRIYSNEAEFELLFKNLSCRNPHDAWACEYAETYSGSYQGQRRPFLLSLYPARYDLELSGSLTLVYPSGRICRYDILPE